MKRFPILVIVAVALMSTAVGTSMVSAGTNASQSEAAVQSVALEQLKAQASPSMTTWQRPL
jgi:ABC-type amino acid transport system permease subunit